MKTIYRFSLILAALLFLSFRGNSQNQVTYGFIQDPVNPFKITAVAYPNYTSSNVTISTAVFSFLLPAGTVTNPSVPPLPGSGGFTNITGTWLAQLLTPSVYQGVGFNPADLQGNDVYQVVLQNSPAVVATNGTPIQLFSFILPSDCIGGNVEVLTNDSPIQQAIFNNLGSNFNNQMSMSINDNPATNIYAGNNPQTFRKACPLNPKPVANADDASTNEDTPVLINVTSNDNFGGDGPSSSAITITAAPANGTATVNNNGTPTNPADDKINYTPNANYNGSDQLIYQICDSNGDCDTAIVKITIIPVNDLPIAYADNATTNEDTPVLINVTSNDDFGGDGPSTSAITITSPPASGTATVNNNGTPNNPTDDKINYTPNANYNGPDQLIYQICDVNGDCDTAIVRITINPVNDLPVANADNASTNEDTPVLINVTTNDDFGGDGPSTSAITITTNPANGTATVNNNGTPSNPTDDKINYTPNPNYNGQDQLIYRICDSNGDCDTALVRITIIPVNDLPLANADNATTNEDTPVLINVTTNDDFGGDGPSTSAITITTNPANGTATVNNNGTPTNPADDRINYTPNPNYNGPDQLIYQICDANGDCDTALVKITIIPVNDLPLANADNASTNEDTPVMINVTTNDDFGGDGPSIGSISIITGVGNGTATVNNNGTPSNPTDDKINYTPNPNYNGPDQLVYQICDANGDCDTAIVRITVIPVNDLPTAFADNASTNEDTPVLINVTTNDDFGGDGPSASAITITSNPANGTATVNNNGTPTNPTDDRINYTPNPNYNGQDQLIYRICDSNGDCDTALVTITIIPVNDLPTAFADNATGDQDTPLKINVTSNDDFGGDGPSTSAITITSAPAHGTATVDNNGTPNNPTDDKIDYNPTAGYSGPDQLIYRICDSNGDCDTALVTITVRPGNVKLSLRVLLQGALLGNEAGLMRDDLRSKGFLPATEPYTALGFTQAGGGGGETVANPGTVFANNSSNSIVDWVFIELRSSADPKVVLATRSALVQRDGDVVDVDGVSPVLFSQSKPGSFYVAVRHRNHLGTMTKTAIALAATGTLVDFTSLSTDLYEANANFDGVEQITLTNRYALWAGNTNVNSTLVFAGENNDKDPIFNFVDGAPGNLFRLQTYILPGYRAGDVNMDGNTIFAGENNDVDPIFNNVDGHPRNLFRLQTFVVPEQLAK